MTCRIGILGTGAYLPATVLTNDELERILDTTAQKILDLTGIRERRIATEYSGPQGAWPTTLYEDIRKDENTSTMGAVAALRVVCDLELRFQTVEGGNHDRHTRPIGA